MGIEKVIKTKWIVHTESNRELFENPLPFVQKLVYTWEINVGVT